MATTPVTQGDFLDQLESNYTINSNSSGATLIPEETIADSGVEHPIYMWIEGNKMYLSVNIQDFISVWDISNPTNPVRLLDEDFGMGVFTGLSGSIWKDGNTIYAADSRLSKVTVWDVSDPKNPTRQTNQEISLLVPGGIWKDGDTLYLTGKYEHMTVWDVSNPTNPVRQTNQEFGQGVFNAATRMFKEGNKMYVTDYVSNRVTVWDLSNPTNPTRLTDEEFGSGVLDEPVVIRIANSKAYVVNKESELVNVWDISNPTNPIRLTDEEFGKGVLINPFGLWIKGDKAYVSSNDTSIGEAGVTVWDLNTGNQIIDNNANNILGKLQVADKKIKIEYSCQNNGEYTIKKVVDDNTIEVNETLTPETFNGRVLHSNNNGEIWELIDDNYYLREKQCENNTENTDDTDDSEHIGEL